MPLPQVVFAHGRRYLVHLDRSVERFALVAGQVRDELRPNLPLRALVSVTVSGPTDRAAQIAQRAGTESRQPGVFCLSGEADWVFSDRTARPYALMLILEAPGYLPAQVGPFVVDGATSFPMLLPDVGLQALPVSVGGRVSDLNGRGLAGVWVQAADGDNPNSAPQGRTVVLRSPLQAAFPAGTAVFGCDISEGAVGLALTMAALPGTRILRLDRRDGLSVDDFLRVGEAEDGAFYRIAAVAGPADRTQPGDVTLSAGLARGYSSGTAARSLSVTTPAQIAALSQAAQPGDTTLLLDAVIGAQQEVRVGNSATGELHLTGAVTGPDGHYRLDGVHRAHSLRLNAEWTDPVNGGVLTLPNPLDWVVDYGKAVNIVNLRLA